MTRKSVPAILVTLVVVSAVAPAGAGVGTGISFAVGSLINGAMLGDPLAFSGEALRYAAVGFAFGVGASVVGGLYPAWKAARAEPVEALRG